MSKAPAIVHCKAFWAEPRNNAKASAAPRRPSKKLAGTYIDELASLGKAIILCRKNCQKKFNVAGAGYSLYKEVTGMSYHWGRCDDCNERVECNTFLKSSRK